MGMQIHPRCSNTKITPAYVNQPFQPDSFLVLKLGDVDIYFDGESQIDELIKAACDGKETWRKYRAAHQPQPPQGEHPYPVRRCRFHGGDGKDGCTLCDEEREVAAREQAAGHPYPEFSVDAMLSAAGVRPAAPPQGGHPYPDMVAAMCDATLPLRHGGELKCVLSDGHFGGHRALNGKRRWHGTGDDARNEDGEPLPPQQHDVSPMQQYDRQAHLAWHERTHPDAPDWPRQPLTDDEALAAIAEYSADLICVNCKTPGVSTPPTFIQVTAGHIAHGVVRDCEKCPVALAITGAIRAPRVMVEAELETITVWVPGERWQAGTPPVAAAFMTDFDNLEGTAAPFNFTLEWRVEEDEPGESPLDYLDDAS